MMAIEGSTGECSITILSGREAAHSPSNQCLKQKVVWETFVNTEALNVVRSTVTRKSGLVTSVFRSSTKSFTIAESTVVV